MKVLTIPTAKFKLVLACLSLLMLTGCPNCNPSVKDSLRKRPYKQARLYELQGEADDEQDSYSLEEQHEFIQAVTNGTPEVLEQVLRSKQDSIDINMHYSEGRTVLHYLLYKRPTDQGVRKSNGEKAKLLIDHGADLTVMDDLGRTLLHEATYGDNLELAQYVLEKLKQDHPEKVSALLNKPENSDVQGTPFKYAVNNGNIAMVKWLIQAGAKPTEKNLVKALKRSAQKGDLAMLHYLMDEVIASKGRRIPKRSVIRMLALAGKRDHTHIMSHLIDKFDEDGSLARAKDRHGMTALHYAAMQGNRRAISLLLAENAAIDEPRNDGKTALHLAAEQGQDSALSTLLSSHADINRQDQTGKTALHLAAENSHRRAVEILLGHRANKSLVDREGKTALDLAQQRMWEDNSRDIKVIIHKLSKTR